MNEKQHTFMNYLAVIADALLGFIFIGALVAAVYVAGAIIEGLK